MREPMYICCWAGTCTRGTSEVPPLVPYTRGRTSLMLDGLSWICGASEPELHMREPGKCYYGECAEMELGRREEYVEGTNED